VSTRLPVLPTDRRCHPRALDNPLRRHFASAAKELDLLGLAPGQTVVDLGTGVGYFAPEILLRIGPRGRLYLVDPDADNLRKAAARVGPDARVLTLRNSAARVSLVPDGSVDRVLLSLVLCCMSDKEGAMDEAWRMLRPGGSVYVSYPRRRLLPARRRTALRVTPERWEAIFRAHAWREVPVRPSWIMVRHRLSRPPPGGVGPDA
jgi:ubiquinone/menaquinone biosynthesis C-methylase UbiE